jgi:hypothetical protein
MKDKRVKLSDIQKDEILKIPLKEGRFKGYSEIAKKFGVHKRTIQFLFEPNKLIHNRELAKERLKKKKETE